MHEYGVTEFSISMCNGLIQNRTVLLGHVAHVGEDAPEEQTQQARDVLGERGLSGQIISIKMNLKQAKVLF